MTKEKEAQILKEARSRLKRAVEDDGENRKMALEDLKFMAEEGAQWPAEILAERLAFKRPCITVNKMPVYVDQVVGDQRMNRPSIKVSPVDNNADVRTASVLGGWTKHVWRASKADAIIDHGFEHSVACGYGAMRVVTKYSSDSSFDQDAFIAKIDNALAVYWGPHTEYDCSDAMYCFLVSDIGTDEFKDKYKVEPVSYREADSQYIDGWATKDTVRVAEYFIKEPITKTLHLLEDGRTVDVLQEGDVSVKSRQVETYKIMWYLLSGNKILEDREWVGKKYIPVIPIWGKELNVGGKRIIRGLIRNAKDSQRMYNYWASVDTETIALQPRNPYLLTARQIEGHEEMWKSTQVMNHVYLLYNPDKDAPGAPQRQAPPQLSSAMVEKLKETDQEIRDTIGLQKAALGMQGNERSGEAIRERKKEGDVGTFAFIDNLSRSIEQLGRVLIDVAPGILDTERIIRLGLDDGGYEFATVNMPLSDGQVLNDLSVGTYDVSVDVGPSFTTQRTEARQSMQEFMQYYPQAATIIGDLYAKAMDWQGADKVAERLEFLLPPEIKQKIEAEKLAKSGEPTPPPVSSPEPPPDPEQALKVQEAQIRIKEAQLKLQQEKVKLRGLEIKNDILVRKGELDLAGTAKSLLAEREESEVETGGMNEELGSAPPEESYMSPERSNIEPLPEQMSEQMPIEAPEEMFGGVPEEMTNTGIE